MERKNTPAGLTILAAATFSLASIDARAEDAQPPAKSVGDHYTECMILQDEERTKLMEAMKNLAVLVAQLEKKEVCNNIEFTPGTCEPALDDPMTVRLCLASGVSEEVVRCLAENVVGRPVDTSSNFSFIFETENPEELEACMDQVDELQSGREVVERAQNHALRVRDRARDGSAKNSVKRFSTFRVRYTAE